jgi:hypothetical protein
MYLDGELSGIGDDGLPSFSQTQAAAVAVQEIEAKQTNRTPREPPIGCWFWPTCDITAADNPRGRASLRKPHVVLTGRLGSLSPTTPLHIARRLKNHRPAHWCDLAADWLEIAKRHRLEAIKAACTWRAGRPQRLCRMASLSGRSLSTANCAA